jgi:hypothetical protein
METPKWRLLHVFGWVCFVLRGKYFCVPTTCVFVQLGDGGQTDTQTLPVGVIGLGSGVAMVALARVRFVLIA